MLEIFEKARVAPCFRKAGSAVRPGRNFDLWNHSAGRGRLHCVLHARLVLRRSLSQLLPNSRGYAALPQRADSRARMLMTARHTTGIFDLMSQTGGYARLSVTGTAIFRETRSPSALAPSTRGGEPVQVLPRFHHQEVQEQG